MKTFLPAIGESDFRSLREAGCSYVDKTAMIVDIVEDNTKVLLFPRPRRFGKTLTLSMLRHFLGRSQDDLSGLFAGLAVSRDAQAMTHFQKYPVISISFKDVKAKTLEGTMAGIRVQLTNAFIEHRKVLDDPRLDPSLVRSILSVLNGTVTAGELPYAFGWLSSALHTHYGERVVILIDEYDTPVQSGYMYDFFDDVVLFFRNFFSACLKDNTALSKVY
jgi:hypothetical protein